MIQPDKWVLLYSKLKIVLTDGRFRTNAQRMQDKALLARLCAKAYPEMDYVEEERRAA